MAGILTGVERIEQALTRTLEREGATSDQGCSALANCLLGALVRCKRDPRISHQVSDEMRRLAAKLLELAAAGEDAISRVLTDATRH
jgi:hypothetical protein